MTPLQVIARVAGPIALPNHPLALDALLASQVALRDGLPVPRHADDCQPIEIPIQREPRGRFHLCSHGSFEWDRHALRYINRRAPIEQYQTLGNDRLRRVQITAGPNKSYRIPMETGHIVNDEMTWWCIGDAGAIRELLSRVLYLGKKRSVGLGRVSAWSVVACLTWPGFPVVRNGKPLRPLPTDWPGLERPRCGYANLTYPYWAHEREELLAIPVRHH